jgi:hypothetical protein
MEVENICNESLASIKELLPDPLFKECDDLISKHSEWLLALELAIDFLLEEEISISSTSFQRFELAFTVMKQGNNERLVDLNKLVRQ